MRSLWRYLDSYSPLVVRLCARRSIGGKHVVALSIQEIALQSGIPVSRLSDISWSLDWNDVTIAEARAFCAACNFDPTIRIHRDRQARYAAICAKNRPNQFPNYLRQSPYWETELK